MIISENNLITRATTCERRVTTRDTVNIVRTAHEATHATARERRAQTARQRAHHTRIARQHANNERMTRVRQHANSMRDNTRDTRESLTIIVFIVNEY